MLIGDSGSCFSSWDHKRLFDQVSADFFSVKYDEQYICISVHHRKPEYLSGHIKHYDYHGLFNVRCILRPQNVREIHKFPIQVVFLLDFI